MNLSERGRNNITAQDVLMPKRTTPPLDNISLEERSAHAVVAFAALAGKTAMLESDEDSFRQNTRTPYLIPDAKPKKRKTQRNSPSVLIRMTAELRAILNQEAKDRNITLNQYCIWKLFGLLPNANSTDALQTPSHTA